MAITSGTTSPMTVGDAELADTARRRLAGFVGRGRLTVRLSDAAAGDDLIVLPGVIVEDLVHLLDVLADPVAGAEDAAIGWAGSAAAAAVLPVEDFSDWENVGG